jgi:M6 family metalloprotease-like protein
MNKQLVAITSILIVLMISIFSLGYLFQNSEATIIESTQEAEAAQFGGRSSLDPDDPTTTSRLQIPLPEDAITLTGELDATYDHISPFLYLTVDDIKYQLEDSYRLFETFYSIHRQELQVSQTVDIIVSQSELDEYVSAQILPVYRFSVPETETDSNMLQRQSLSNIAPDTRRTYANVMCIPGSDAQDFPAGTKTYIENLMDDPTIGLEQYFNDVSFGTMQVRSRTLDPVRLDGPKSYWESAIQFNVDFVVNSCLNKFYQQNNNQPAFFNDGGFNYEFDSVQVFLSDELDPNWIGLATIFPTQLSSSFFTNSPFSGPTYSSHFILQQPFFGSYDQAVLAHEMGHNMGWLHSGIDQDYDSKWDVMSDAWSGFNATYGNTAQGTFMGNTYYNGWVPVNEIYQIDEQPQEFGDFTFDLEQTLDGNMNASSYRAASMIIQDSNIEDRIWFEARNQVSHDANIPGEGVVVYYDYFFDRVAYLNNESRFAFPNRVIDFDGNNNINDTGVVVEVGESFEIANSGVTITVNSEGATSYNVTVSIPERPKVTYQRSIDESGFVLNDEALPVEIPVEVVPPSGKSIDRVELYLSDSFFSLPELIDTDSTAPYTLNYNHLPANGNSFLANIFVYDQDGVVNKIEFTENEFYLDFAPFGVLFEADTSPQYGGRSPSHTSEVYFNDRIVQAVRGNNNFVYTRTSDDGRTWNQFQQYGGKTTDIIEQYVFNNTLFQAIRGGDDDIYMRTSSDGMNYTPWRFQGGRTLSKVTMVEFDGKLFQFVRGGDNAIYQRSTVDGSTWTPFTQYGGRTRSAPAVIVHNGRLIQSVQGFGNNAVYTRSTTNGTSWSAWNLDGQTRNTPEMVSYDGTVYHTVRGVNSNAIYMRTSTNGVTWSGWSFAGASGLDTPEFTVTGVNLIQTSIGGDRNIYIRDKKQGGTWSSWRPVRIYQFSPTFAQIPSSSSKPSVLWFADPDTSDQSVDDVLILTDTTINTDVYTRTLTYPY